MLEEFNESQESLVRVSSYHTIYELEYTLAKGCDSLPLEWIVIIPFAIVVVGYLLTCCSESLPLKWKSQINIRCGEPKPTRDLKEIPHHIAVIMDGNRRYGRARYGLAAKGHTDGSEKLVKFVDWCRESGIKALTVFAFSTENWNRDPKEVAVLMGIFEKFMDRIAAEAVCKNIQVRVLTSDGRKLPPHIKDAIGKIETATAACKGFVLSICVSYGARDEIVNSCKALAREVVEGTRTIDDITEQAVAEKLLTHGVPDPDIILRTSGEIRLSNFLLYQLAYAELIFVDKYWPDFTRTDLDDVLYEFNRRKRRFGK